jgi:hypothetical protein
MLPPGLSGNHSGESMAVWHHFIHAEPPKHCTFTFRVDEEVHGWHLVRHGVRNQVNAQERGNIAVRPVLASLHRDVVLCTLLSELRSLMSERVRQPAAEYKNKTISESDALSFACGV